MIAAIFFLPVFSDGQSYSALNANSTPQTWTGGGGALDARSKRAAPTQPLTASGPGTPAEPLERNLRDAREAYLFGLAAHEW